jgi:hypothetical protein
VENKDPRANGPDFSAAKQKKLLRLLERGNFKVVLREIPENAPVVTGRLDLVVKTLETDQEAYKARYVVGAIVEAFRGFSY